MARQGLFEWDNVLLGLTKWGLIAFNVAFWVSWILEKERERGGAAVSAVKFIIRPALIMLRAMILFITGARTALNLYSVSVAVTCSRQ